MLRASLRKTLCSLLDLRFRYHNFYIAHFRFYLEGKLHPEQLTPSGQKKDLTVHTHIYLLNIPFKI